MDKKKTIAHFCLLVLLDTCQLGAISDHLCPFDNIPSLVATYELVDLGKTDLDPSRLSNTSKKSTLAPKINDNGIIIGNTSKGGFVTFPDRWMFAPEFNGMTINFHEINNRGDLLVAVERGQESIEWMRWPCIEGSYGTHREHINTIDPFTAKFHVSDFNDDSTVVAYGPDCGCSFRPLEWNPCNGLDRLGARENVEIKGTARRISNNGTVVGVFDKVTDQAPYVWNPWYGLLIANHYRQYLDPTGWVEFADLLVAENSTVYGTYRIKHLADTYVVRGHFYETRQSNGSYYEYNAFTWTPATGQIEMIDLQGMRLSAVNSCQTVVGSLLGSAALCERGKAPVLLMSLIEPESVKGWNLLEVTDINDQNQMVGYGWYQDKIHLFLAKPLQ